MNERQSLGRLAGPLSKKVKFTRAEDIKLRDLVNKYSTNNWKIIAKELPPRTPRQCRERWNNYIDPNLSQEPWTQEEDEILMRIHDQFGNHWKQIESYLPNRSKNSIKKRWSALMASEAQPSPSSINQLNDNSSLLVKKLPLVFLAPNNLNIPPPPPPRYIADSNVLLPMPQPTYPIATSIPQETILIQKDCPQVVNPILTLALPQQIPTYSFPQQPQPQLIYTTARTDYPFINNLNR